MVTKVVTNTNLATNQAAHLDQSQVVGFAMRTMAWQGMLHPALALIVNSSTPVQTVEHSIQDLNVTRMNEGICCIRDSPGVD